LIEEYLLQSNTTARRGLRTTISRLYKARLAADYKLTQTVDDSVTLGALRDAKSIFRILGVDDGKS
jgi:hypothetical protein